LAWWYSHGVSERGARFLTSLADSDSRFFAAQGQSNDEAAAVADFTLHSDVSAVHAGYPTTDRKADAGATHRPRLRVVPAVEALKDLLELVWRDAKALV
jgi:hypothetical protein